PDRSNGVVAGVPVRRGAAFVWLGCLTLTILPFADQGYPASVENNPDTIPQLTEPVKSKSTGRPHGRVRREPVRHRVRAVLPCGRAVHQSGSAPRLVGVMRRIDLRERLAGGEALDYRTL